MFAPMHAHASKINSFRLFNKNFKRGDYSGSIVCLLKWLLVYLSIVENQMESSQYLVYNR